MGHVQRGGSPNARDRIVASEMGNKAVKLLLEGIGNRVIAIKDDKMVDFDIFEALNMTKKIDLEIFNIAHEISI
ncbi:ATP-dependent 6-phosphofructokinase [bioreactor metagenome]|uniref:ATP-dependent 6-phosphofructokinase n=1 Tax=bioreactor metagenome TaxID=1076179 RepID=A0A645HDW1_9ZZZZ